MDLGNYQKNIPELQPLNNFRYENIFKMYKENDNDQFFYNITKKIVLPKNLNPDQFIFYPIRKSMPWTMVSFNLYSTIELWWLICLVNDIKNPVVQPKAGTFVKALKADLVNSVLNNITSQLL
jgi:hypothetical protein